MIGAQFGARRFVDRVARDDFAATIDIAGELVNHGLGHIGEQGESAGHVAVNGAVTDGHFALVAGRDDHAVEFVRDSHERDPAQAGLQILLGDVRIFLGEYIGHLFLHRFEPSADRHGVAFDAEVAGEREGIVDAALRGVGSGHGHPEDVFFAERGNSQRGGHRRIDPAAQPDDHLLESAFGQIIVESEHQRFVHVAHIVVRREFRRSGGRNGDQRNIFAEPRQLVDDRAIAIENEGVTVENKLVIASDKVRVDEGNAEIFGDSAEHDAAPHEFARFEGGGAQVKQKSDAGFFQFVDRAASVVITRQVFRGPQIFANGNPGFLSRDLRHGHFCRRFEVTTFVEDVISRQ